MARAYRLLLAVALVMVGCGREYTCTSGRRGLIMHPSNGIEGEYIVMLAKDVDARSESAVLAAKHSGTVLSVWDGLGFEVRMNNAADAATLAAEPSVCVVEQNAWAGGGSPAAN